MNLSNIILELKADTMMRSGKAKFFMDAIKNSKVVEFDYSSGEGQSSRYWALDGETSSGVREYVQPYAIGFSVNQGSKTGFDEGVRVLILCYIDEKTYSKSGTDVTQWRTYALSRVISDSLKVMGSQTWEDPKERPPYVELKKNFKGSWWEENPNLKNIPENPNLTVSTPPNLIPEQDDDIKDLEKGIEDFKEKGEELKTKLSSIAKGLFNGNDK